MFKVPLMRMRRMYCVISTRIVGEDRQQLLQPIVSYSVQYNQQYDRTLVVHSHTFSMSKRRRTRWKGVPVIYSDDVYTTLIIQSHTSPWSECMCVTVVWRWISSLDLRNVHIVYMMQSRLLCGHPGAKTYISTTPGSPIEHTCPPIAPACYQVDVTHSFAAFNVQCCWDMYNNTKTGTNTSTDSI